MISQKTRNKRNIALIVTAICFLTAMFMATFTLSINVEAETLATNVSNIEGLTYNVNSNASASEFTMIYTDEMTAWSSEEVGEYVIFSYKIDSATAENARFGIMWGGEYSGNSLYSSEQQGGLLYVDGAESPLFCNANVGKYVTFIMKRSGLGTLGYITDSTPVFDVTSGVKVVDASDWTAFANAFGYDAEGKEYNIYSFDYDGLKNATRFGLILGSGTGVISELKVFDENGNNLGVNVTGDLSSHSESVLTTNVSNIEGLTYNVNSNASASEFTMIYTDEMTAWSSEEVGEYVIFSYKIDSATAENARFGVMWGGEYSGNSLYSSEQQGGLLYVDGAESPLFCNANVGKYVTFIMKRSGLGTSGYITDSTPVFDVTSGVKVVDASNWTAFANAFGYDAEGKEYSIYSFDYDGLKNATRFGLILGSGTGVISELKVFDENGNNLGVNVTGDLSLPSTIDLNTIATKEALIDSDISEWEFTAIYTDSMETLSNTKVIFSYKIEEACANPSRIGVVWGQSYEDNKFYDVTRKGCWFFDDYPSGTSAENFFIREELEGKYVTFVISRNSLSCPVYVSDEAPAFDSNLVVYNGGNPDVNTFAYQMTGMSSTGEELNIYGYGSNTDILLDNKIVGIIIGDVEGKISDIRVFDENGNAIGYNFTGDFYNYELTAEETENGTVTLPKDKVLDGEEIVIAIEADEGYVIDSFMVNEVEKVEEIVNGEYILTVEENMDIVATFKAIEYTATVIAYGKDSVEVKFSAGNKAEKLAEIKAMMTADTDIYDYSDNIPTELALENITITETRAEKEYTATITVYGKEPVEIKFTNSNREEKLAEIKAMMTENSDEYTYTNNIPEELPLSNISIVETGEKVNGSGCNGNINGVGGLLGLLLLGAVCIVVKNKKKTNK